MSDAASPAPRDVTELLLAWRSGDAGAFDRLVPAVAGELSRLARAYLRREASQRTLQTADLVQETYLRLVDANRIDWQNRAHFFAIAARSMRRVLVDAARARQSQKRGGERRQVDLESNVAIAEAPDLNLVALDAALAALSEVDARRARVVELRFFGGLTVEETAVVLEVSPETVMRDWKVAKAWLFRRLTDGDLDPPPGGAPSA